ncbi:MAG: biotin--[acetyl-CoA-carboxylase] ligase [bacterium]|nr:biotin--[acetyl-CoA-carboxylase] ligase [bacterium]
MATPYVTRIEDRVHSTQDYARIEFETSQKQRPVLVIAHAQDAGRGRRDNPWWNCPRSMLASLAVTSPPVEHVTLVPLMAGLAAHHAAESQLGVETSLKWPNDVLIGAAKVGGILSERRDDTLVVGCGLNLWWPDAPDGAAGLVEHDPGQSAAVDLAHDWVARILKALNGLPDSFDKATYVEACTTIGRHITWTPNGEGRAVGISADGALVVDTESGQRTIRSGEVSHVRPATIPPATPDKE